MNTPKIPRVVTHSYAQMVADLKKDPAQTRMSLNAQKCDMLHMAMGIVTEVVELSIAIELSNHRPMYSMAKNVVEELGDTQFYIQGMCGIFNLVNDARWLEEFIEQDELESFKGFEQVPDQLHSSMKMIAHAGGLMDYVKRVAIYNRNGSAHVVAYHLMGLISCLSDIASKMVDDESEVFEFNEQKLLKGKNARYKDGKYSDEAAQLRSDKEPSNPLMERKPAPIKEYEEPVPSKGPDHHL